jgi:predicted nucleotide-binding protein
MAEKSKQPLNDAEREVARFVIERFVKNDEATSERLLMKDLKPLRPRISEALRKLVGRSVFKALNNVHGEEIYVPNAIAFHYCGDADFLEFAKKSTAVILSVIRNLYERELDTDGYSSQKPFTREEAEAEARTIDPTVKSEMVRVGLALAEEFAVLRTLQRNQQQIGVTSFVPAKHIFELGDSAWDDHIKRSGVLLESDPEDKRRNQNAAFQAGWPLEATGLTAYLEPDNRKVFLVHGRAEEPKQAVAAFLRQIGVEVIILHEKPNQGLTIIEKFEKHSGVGFAVVLLTPDDIGGPAASPQKMSLRARQNVILELGYFLAKLGRNRVCCLYVEGVELPSDYDGVLYVPYGEDWRAQLAKELIAAEIEVDSTNLVKALSEERTETTRQSASNSPKLDAPKAESRLVDPIAEKRWNRVRDEISKLPEYNREGLRLLLEYPSLTDYTALQKLGQLARQNSLASVLPGRILASTPTLKVNAKKVPIFGVKYRNSFTNNVDGNRL